MPETPTEIADQLFETHRSVFGDDFAPYRGHVMRTIELTTLQVGEVETSKWRPLGVAGFFHDAAIWFDDTWDYLQPSIDRAIDTLGDEDADHADLVAAIIGEHHRIRPSRHPDPLVEAYRRADMADVFHPLRAPGVTRTQYRTLVDKYPFHGFRRMLARAFARGLRNEPLRPMPMMKW